MHRLAGIVIQGALVAQRDHHSFHAFCQQCGGCKLSLVNRRDRQTGKCLGLGFVGGDIVAQRQHFIRQAGRRGGVQDGGHASGAGNLQTSQGGGDRLLQLGNKDRSRADEIRLRLDILRRNTARSTGGNDDRVVACGVFDEDIGRPGIAFGIHLHLGHDARLGPGRMGNIGKGVGPQPGDEVDLAPRHGRCDGLVRPLPPRPQHE